MTAGTSLSFQKQSLATGPDAHLLAGRDLTFKRLAAFVVDGNAEIVGLLDSAVLTEEVQRHIFFLCRGQIGVDQDEMNPWNIPVLLRRRRASNDDKDTVQPAQLLTLQLARFLDNRFGYIIQASKFTG